MRHLFQFHRADRHWVLGLAQLGMGHQFLLALLDKTYRWPACIHGFKIFENTVGTEPKQQSIAGFT